MLSEIINYLLFYLSSFITCKECKDSGSWLLLIQLFVGKFENNSNIQFKILKKDYKKYWQGPFLFTCSGSCFLCKIAEKS